MSGQSPCKCKSHFPLQTLQTRTVIAEHRQRSFARGFLAEFNRGIRFFDFFFFSPPVKLPEHRLNLQYPKARPPPVPYRSVPCPPPPPPRRRLPSAERHCPAVATAGAAQPAPNPGFSPGFHPLSQPPFSLLTSSSPSLIGKETSEPSGKQPRAFGKFGVRSHGTLRGEVEARGLISSRCFREGPNVFRTCVKRVGFSGGAKRRFRVGFLLRGKFGAAVR